jgi:hypothetical protein
MALAVGHTMASALGKHINHDLTQPKLEKPQQ